MRKFWFAVFLFSIVLFLFSLKFGAPPERSHVVEKYETENLKYVADQLRSFKKKNGYYPSMKENMPVLFEKPDYDPDLAKDIESIREGAKKDNTDIAEWMRYIRPRPDGASKQNHYLTFMVQGFSGWGSVPYLYENRTGLERKAFDKSPVTDGSEGFWVVKVDEGIYLYSLPAMYLAERINSGRFITIILWSVSGILFVSSFIFCPSRKKDSDTPLYLQPVRLILWAGILFGGFITFSAMSVIACYPGTILAMRRHKLGADKYEELIRYYSGQGIIPEKTCEKLLKHVSDMDPEKNRTW